MFHLRLFHDVYPPGAAVTATRPAPHSILYVFAGSAAIAGSPLTQQEAGYFRDDLSVEAARPEPRSGAGSWSSEPRRHCRNDCDKAMPHSRIRASAPICEAGSDSRHDERPAAGRGFL